MRAMIRDEILQSDNTALTDDKGNQITYKELAEQAEKLKRHMEERSLLFILCDHQMETAEFIYQVMYLERVPLLLADDIDGELLEHLINIYQPQYIYCKLTHGLCGCYAHKAELGNHILLKTEKKMCDLHPDLALLLSTSGTTGSAKLVRLSYDNLYDNAEGACVHLNIRKGQKGISPLPLNHAYGFAFCLWHWHCGATVLMTGESVISKGFGEFFTKEKANHFAATPYTFYMLQKIRFWNSEKLKTLHWAMSGGAQLSEQGQNDLTNSLEGKFCIGYGQTECTCIISATDFTDGNIKWGTVGKPFRNMKITIDRKTGELIIQSKSVCMGYVERKEQLADGDVNQGILHTGDVADIDNEGYIYLRGRLKRYVKILGKRISLDDMADYLERKYKNAEFACTGTDDNIVVYHTGTDDDMEKEIRNLLDRSLKIPSRFVSCLYISEIPRNSSGKIAYAKLKEFGSERKNNGAL